VCARLLPWPNIARAQEGDHGGDTEYGGSKGQAAANLKCHWQDPRRLTRKRHTGRRPVHNWVCILCISADIRRLPANRQHGRRAGAPAAPASINSSHGVQPACMWPQECTYVAITRQARGAVGNGTLWHRAHWQGTTHTWAGSSHSTLALPRSPAARRYLLASGAGARHALGHELRSRCMHLPSSGPPYSGLPDLHQTHRRGRGIHAAARQRSRRRRWPQSDWDGSRLGLKACRQS